MIWSGSIFGTGTNGAYVEKVEKITKLGDAPVRKLGGEMVVNCEWGAFNNTVRLRLVLRYVPIIDHYISERLYQPRHTTTSLTESR